jgi:hypothetical protein
LLAIEQLSARNVLSSGSTLVERRKHGKSLFAPECTAGATCTTEPLFYARTARKVVDLVQKNYQYSHCFSGCSRRENRHEARYLPLDRVSVIEARSLYPPGGAACSTPLKERPPYPTAAMSLRLITGRIRTCDLLTKSQRSSARQWSAVRTRSAPGLPRPGGFLMLTVQLRWAFARSFSPGLVRGQ